MHIKYILLFILIHNIQGVCHCQKDQRLDSLINEISLTRSDSNKVKVLNETSTYLNRKNKISDSRKYTDEAKTLAQKINYPAGLANSYYNSGLLFYLEGNYPEALKELNLSLQIKESLKDRFGIAALYNGIGNVFKSQGKHAEALHQHQQALNLFIEIKDKKGIADSYNNIGIINEIQGNSVESINNHRRALKIREEIGDKNGMAASYSNMGISYKTLGNYSESLKNHLASLKICEETGNKRTMATTYSNIGVIYNRQGNYDDALKNYLASVSIREELNDKKGTADCYNNIGNLYNDIQKYSDALINHTNALKKFEEIGDKVGIAIANSGIGNDHFDQGNYQEALINHLKAKTIHEEIGNKSGIANIYNVLGYDYTKLDSFHLAEEFLMKGLTISKETGNKLRIINNYEALTDLETARDNYKQALVYHKQSIIYKDSLLNEGNNKLIAEMKTKYESEKKDKEIQQLENKKQIDSLQLMVQQESLTGMQAEKNQIIAENRYNIQQVKFMANEKKLQVLEIEKNQVNLHAQQIEMDNSQDELVLLNKEAQIQKLEIKKQTLIRNYMIGGFVLFALFSIFVYKNYRTRQQLKLQTLRNKIAIDLHDDVGSTLSSISIFSQIAKDQSKEVIPLLDTIGESSRKMLDAMADIVWTINPENDQFEKIILRMRSFAYELLGAKSIDFEFIADEDVSKLKLQMDVRKNLYLIFKEATNNMVKYSDASKARFEIKEEKENLYLSIHDNGKGFDLNQTNQGNGLKNMKKRAEEIGARLSIKSMPHSGTLIQLIVPV